MFEFDSSFEISSRIPCSIRSISNRTRAARISSTRGANSAWYIGAVVYNLFKENNIVRTELLKIHKMVDQTIKARWSNTVKRSTKNRPTDGVMIGAGSRREQGHGVDREYAQKKSLKEDERFELFKHNDQVAYFLFSVCDSS